MSEKYRKVTLGWFYFPSRPAKVTDQSLQIALCNIVAHIAGHDAIYSKAVATIISNSATHVDLSSASSIWRTFIASQYPNTSKQTLFLVLVGIDKMEQVDQVDLTTILEDVLNQKLRIRMLLVGQPHKAVI
jgi:hypothetical protein